MHYIGYLIYIAAIAATTLSPAAADMVKSSYELATTITVGCFILAAYPPLLLMSYQLRGKTDENSADSFAAVVTMTSATVVSLGLVGTFIGLTQMITKISSAISFKGKTMEDQVQHVMAAIGSSLDSMSFAFLTSVMGVASAVVITCAATYFREYFKSPIVEDEESLDEVCSRIKKLEVNSSKVRMILQKYTKISVDRNELASLVISNSLQTKELSKIIAELHGEYNAKSEVGKELIVAIKDTCGGVNSIKSALADAGGVAENIAKTVNEISITSASTGKDVKDIKVGREKLTAAIANII